MQKQYRVGGVGVALHVGRQLYTQSKHVVAAQFTKRGRTTRSTFGVTVDSLGCKKRRTRGGEHVKGLVLVVLVMVDDEFRREEGRANGVMNGVRYQMWKKCSARVAWHACVLTLEHVGAGVCAGRNREKGPRRMKTEKTEAGKGNNVCVCSPSREWISSRTRGQTMAGACHVDLVVEHDQVRVWTLEGVVSKGWTEAGPSESRTQREDIQWATTCVCVK